MTRAPIGWRVCGLLTALALGAPLGGCVVYTVASTAVSVTATAVETTVDVAAGAVDLVVGDDDDED